MKGNNKVLDIILAIIIIILSGFLVYFYVFLDKKDEQINNNETSIVYSKETCLKNIDEIYDKVVEYENNSFTAKYFPSYLSIPSLEELYCDESKVESDNAIYMINDNYGKYYKYDLDKDIVTEVFYEGNPSQTDDNTAAFALSKELVHDDMNLYKENHPEFDLGTYANTYDGGNVYILSICEYPGEEGSECIKHYYDYEINFNDKSFKRINVDVE